MAKDGMLEGGAILETSLSRTTKTQVLVEIVGPVVAKVGHQKVDKRQIPKTGT